jgi:hypothetical protein
VNRNGNSDNLVASHPLNAHAARHGVYSGGGRLLHSRAAEVAHAIQTGPHVHPIDELGAIEIGRLVALIEAADADLATNGLTRRGDARALLKLRLQASRRLQEWLSAYGRTPRGRAQLIRDVSSGASLSAEIAKRRAA